MTRSGCGKTPIISDYCEDIFNSSCIANGKNSRENLPKNGAIKIKKAL